VSESNTAGAGGADTPGFLTRRLMRRADGASLATIAAGEAAGWPYASLVETALAPDASPLLLLSDLAEHSRNIAADSRVSLLFDGTAGLAEPLAGPRVTVMGRAERCDSASKPARAWLERFLSYHPGARGYAAFADFHLYRVTLDRAHLVSGFGQIHWIPGADLQLADERYAPLAAAEPRIVEHMNRDHGEAIGLIAGLLHRDQGHSVPAEGWRLAGLDPEGFDLRAPRAALRGRFAQPVIDAASARQAFVSLTQSARARAGQATSSY
jgi:putative heme iron utilization protein